MKKIIIGLVFLFCGSIVLSETKVVKPLKTTISFQIIKEQMTISPSDILSARPYRDPRSDQYGVSISLKPSIVKKFNGFTQRNYKQMMNVVINNYIYATALQNVKTGLTRNFIISGNITKSQAQALAKQLNAAK